MIIGYIVTIILVITVLSFKIAAKNFDKIEYSYDKRKNIKLKNVLPFRDIPCNNDLIYANALLYINDIKYNKTNIIGAIILKWIKEGKVEFTKIDSIVLHKEENALDLTLKSSFESETEKKLFTYMYIASKDGILEKREFENWCTINYEKISEFLDNIAKEEIEKLKKENLIIGEDVLTDSLYDDSIKLYGLYNYLEEFAGLKEKEIDEVKSWEDYLVFACLFGNANKVLKQVRKLYPEYIEKLKTYDDNFDDIKTFSNTFYNSAVTGKYQKELSEAQKAESYSSGGGGFSSGGGGGGSFGGAGGGSR